MGLCSSTFLLLYIHIRLCCFQTFLSISCILFQSTWMFYFCQCSLNFCGPFWKSAHTDHWHRVCPLGHFPTVDLHFPYSKNVHIFPSKYWTKFLLLASVYLSSLLRYFTFMSSNILTALSSTNLINVSCLHSSGR